MALPVFKYHPDPVSTGSIIESDAKCAWCGNSRGFIYAGPVYAIEEYAECICPWCIADGSAHENLDASFADEEGVGDNGAWDDVPQEVIDEIAYRTPGFSGWQQERWWTHCGDAAQFIGRAGRNELSALGAEAVASVQNFVGLSDGPEWNSFFAELDKDGSPTAYMFRCTRCGELGGYADSG